METDTEYSALEKSGRGKKTSGVHPNCVLHWCLTEASPGMHLGVASRWPVCMAWVWARSCGSSEVK